MLNAAKKRKDAIEMYKQANRSDLQEKEELELHIIQSYLPKQLSEEEIYAAINALISSTVKKSGSFCPILGPSSKVVGSSLTMFSSSKYL